MRKSTEISNTVIVETTPRKKSGVVSHYPFNEKTVDKRIAKLYDVTYNAFKIISIALVSEDSDFFAEKKNIIEFYRIFEVFKITLGDDGFDEEAFYKKPIDEWIKLISLLFITLYSIPNHGGVSCDKISYNGNSEYFSISIDTNTVDYKPHSLGMLISKDDKFVLIDNEIIMTNN